MRILSARDILSAIQMLNAGIEYWTAERWIQRLVEGDGGQYMACYHSRVLSSKIFENSRKVG